jgi:penicillin-binding protein 2
MGIGQGEITETPLQIANSMCLIGNKGYYYTPHIVDSIAGDDTTLKKFKVRHETTHIPTDIFQHVIDGMEGVVNQGTGQNAKVPGIAICGKTGTAQNSYKGVPQKDHALFAAFAPKDNPRIAIVVICENAGWGGNSAAPIAGLMIEKYLHDSISDDRKALEQRMINLNLIPDRIYQARDSIAKARALAAAEKKRLDGEEDQAGSVDEQEGTPASKQTPAATTPKASPRTGAPKTTTPTGTPGAATPAKKGGSNDSSNKKKDTSSAPLQSQAMLNGGDQKKHKPRPIV